MQICIKSIQINMKTLRACLWTAFVLGLSHPLSTNADKWDTQCIPAACHQEMSCYCADYDYPDPFLEVFAKRCDDVNGYLINGKCHVQTSEGLQETGAQSLYDYLYSTRKSCEGAVTCGAGQYHVGCKRDTRGYCKACDESFAPLQPNHYWDRTQLSCVQKQCDVTTPGYFVFTPCAGGNNIVTKPCIEYEGNPKSLIQNPGIRQHYCPGQNKVIPIPSDASANADYSFFSCNSGFYLMGTEDSYFCNRCPRGYACMHNKQYLCPKDYYSDETGRSTCKPCTSSCGPYSVDRVPLRCAEGSTKDAKCTMCNSCGIWPTTGLDCVQDPSLMPTTECRPCNTQSEKATCC